jgi:hypothetical protein
MADSQPTYRFDQTQQTPGDDWRLHELRRRAKGKGKYPMPAGRYSALKKPLGKNAVPRAPRRTFCGRLEVVR